MSELSGPFNFRRDELGQPDRVYDANWLAEYLSMFFTDGVFIQPTSNLQVLASTGRSIVLNTGYAFIEGRKYENTEQKTFEIPVTGNVTEYVVVCELSKSNREIVTKVKERVGSTPVNDGNIHELWLAGISVSTTAVNITQAMITDYRPDETKCGFVACAIDQINTANLFAQFQSAFDIWFNTIKGKLGDEPATALQTQILEINKMLEASPVIRSGVSEPSDLVGKDGDVYIKIVS